MTNYELGISKNSGIPYKLPFIEFLEMPKVQFTK